MLEEIWHNKMHHKHKRIIARTKAIHIEIMLEKTVASSDCTNSNFNCKHCRNCEWNRTRWVQTDRSSDVQELLESQDEDLTETVLEEMLNSQPIEEEASTSTGNVTFNLKNLSEGLRIANELCNFFMKIDPSMEQSLIFKRQIVMPLLNISLNWRSF